MEVVLVSYEVRTALLLTPITAVAENFRGAEIEFFFKQKQRVDRNFPAVHRPTRLLVLKPSLQRMVTLSIPFAAIRDYSASEGESGRAQDIEARKRPPTGQQWVKSAGSSLGR
ncbi:hypothetical protein [Bradyrhizobium neotropicale]|uniref:Uncharacterized protein n=1 Tax=Bradyrhizobium neotropicale TaxID=1497615 RepID=A0A176ZDD3_9BRAD|nr:hypothetical protein [Bradyrhizobium neotropicale]OAF17935.1 hypothetical protein AXW67_05270 [Bradyrhizobium neotropicale]